MIPIDIQVTGQGQRSRQFPTPCATDKSRTLCPRSFKLGRLIVLDEYRKLSLLIFRSVGQRSRSKVKTILNILGKGGGH